LAPAIFPSKIAGISMQSLDRIYQQRTERMMAIKNLISHEADDLRKIGFELAAVWKIQGNSVSYSFLDTSSERMIAAFSVSNALYAFTLRNQVLYIGKTTQSLSKRFQGYCNPQKKQSTNNKCNNAIREYLNRNEIISILVFAPPTDLQYRGYEINLPGGLEDILIRRFNPPWNGLNGGIAVTESTENELLQIENSHNIQEHENNSEEIFKKNPAGCFSIELKATYYNRGIINPGKKADSLFGDTDRMAVITFSDGTPSVSSRIDRRANRSGAARLVGSNQIIANWFQQHFECGQKVTALVRGPYEIEFQLPKK